MAKKKSEVFKCESKRIISIGEEETGSDIFMSIKFCLLDTLTNLNGIQYSPAFLQEIANNQQKYLSLPLMAEFNKLSKGQTGNLTHAYNQNTGVFSSQMIGSFISFQVKPNADDATILELVGEARIPKRFDAICEVLQELFNSGNLTLSYEIAVAVYSMANGVKFVDVDECNFLFAMAVVTNPAVLSSRSLTLVAQIMEGENLGENLIATTRNNVLKNNTNLKEDNSMTIEELEVKVANLRVEIATKDAKLKENAADSKEKDAVLTKKEAEAKAKQDELDKQKKEAAAKDTEAEAKKKELEAKKKECAEITEKLNVLSASLLEKDKELASLLPIKEAYETAEATKVADKLIADKAALKDKFSKVLSAEVMTEMAEALENLDEAKLNSKVVEIAMASTKAPNKVNLASRITDNVKLAGAEPGSLREKYSI